MYKKTALGIILLTAIFLRFWELEERFVFSGETNNILYAVEKLVTRQQSPLLGLVAAEYVQHLFHSPWYLYLMAPVFWATGGDPLAFAGLHSLLGVIGTFLLFRTGEIIYSTKAAPKATHLGGQAGLLAALVNAVWMTAVTIDRTVWAVGLVPFASILAMYLAVRADKEPTGWRFAILGAWLGVALSFHYQVLVMIGLVMIWIWFRHRRFFWQGLIPLVFSLAPLVIFDWRHEAFNLKGLWLVLKSVVEGTRPYSSAHFFLPVSPAADLGVLDGIGEVKQDVGGGAGNVFCFNADKVIFWLPSSPQLR